MCSSDFGTCSGYIGIYRESLENEINSANDNPIINVEDQHVYHGGNFHGDYISLKWTS
jgi:histidine ammonia-lyase